MALKPLLVRITGDDTDLQRTLNASGQALKGLVAAAGAASVAMVGALGAIAVQGIAAGKEIQILADRANATPEAFQRMAAAARTAGIEQDKLSDILQDVNDRVGDFLSTGAGPMADFFENIAPKVGVTADQFRRLSGPEALQLYVSSLEKAGVNQKQMTFYLEAMASDVTMLLPLLRDGGAAMTALGDAAQQSGSIISADMLESIVAADTAMKAIGETLRSVQLRLSAELAPALQAAAQQIAALAQSEEAQAAIQRLVTAFGDLSRIILSEDFIGAAVAGLEMLMGVAATVAEGMVYLSQNVELVTVGLSGMAIAAAALGGPLWLVAGALSAALVGLAAWRGKAEEAKGGTDALKAAQDALNASLGTFSGTAAPNAGAEAVALAKTYEQEAKAALVAAEANLALAQSRLQDEEAESGRNRSRGRVITLEEDAEAAKASVDELQTTLENARRTLAALQIGEYSGRGGGGTPPADDDDGTGDTAGTDTPVDVPSIGGGSSVADQMKSRLEALQAGLMTEKETIDAWRNEGLETLEAALEAELLTVAEYNEAKERLQAEHSERMAAIVDAENQARMRATQGALGDLASLMRSGNEKLFKIGQAAAIANAVVSGYEAAVDAWKAGMKIGGPPVAAAFTAASLARTGALIAQIASQSPSGSGSSSASGGGGGGSTAAAAAVETRTVSEIRFMGALGASGEMLVKTINDEYERGNYVRAVVG
ncbi:MAG: hypothetical protein Tp176DCM1853251_64 [Prokaryotic dsDNA virus sp.]|nr:MAG: hypothetical protein Tp176DCM1853251_64 [Prokaryotic dsDNA virus sp.]|tara:strand:- start:3759 stop:5906 length:2148 start_codon:yes stop_codon:yes gene_type:complete